jgi:osmotically-inducible protein OsmY
MGLLMGAAAMYLFDAENGERRRASVARRVDQYRYEIERTIERERTRVRFQVGRTARETLRRMRESLVPDAAILREIHGRMEEVLSFEEAAQIHVTVQRGQVTLEGAIAEDRLNRLLGRVATAPGVRGLDNRLIVHTSTTR